MANDLCVLVVDDSMTARKWTSLTLRQLRPELNVIEASDASEAVAAVESNDVGAMLIDLNMPETDGFKLCEELLERVPGCHVAIVTANVQDRVKKRALERGYQFVAKPVNKEKLSAFVEVCEKSNAGA